MKSSWRTGKFKWYAALTLIAVLGYHYSQSQSKPRRSSSANAAHRWEDGIPTQEVQFCNLFFEFNNYQPPRETNPIREATAPIIKDPDWNAKMHAVMGDSGAFTNWKGTVRFTVTNSKEVGVEVSIPGEHTFAQLVTTPGGIGQKNHLRVPDTQLKLGSDLSNALSTMQWNQPVIVSGVMFYWHGLYLPPEFDGTDQELTQRLFGTANNYAPDLAGYRRSVVLAGNRTVIVRFDKIVKQ